MTSGVIFRVRLRLTKTSELTKRTRLKLNDIKLANLRIGLLINFGAALLKDDIHRLANQVPESTQ